MDTYSGYNQIKIDPLDGSKTKFMSNHGNYYYSAMPFNMKNTNTIYQRLRDGVLSKKIGINLEVYIDDMIMNTLEEKSYYASLEDILESAGRYKHVFEPYKVFFRCLGRQVPVIHAK